MDPDSRIAGAAVALYFILSSLLLPTTEHLRALGGGLLVFVGIAALAAWLGRGTVDAAGVLLVTFASGAILVFPALPAIGGRVPWAVPLGFLGTQAAVLLWAARRWVPRKPALDHTPLLQTWFIAALGAAGLSVIATIPIALMYLTDRDFPTSILLVYPGYFAGLLAAATIYWLLQRVAHLAVGRYLIGVLGGICVYGAVAPVVMLVDGKPLDIRMMAIIAAIAGGLVGTAVAMQNPLEAQVGT